MIPISNVLLVPEVNAFKHSLYETKTVFLKYGIKLLDYQGKIWPFTKNEKLPNCNKMAKKVKIFAK